MRHGIYSTLSVLERKEKTNLISNTSLHSSLWTFFTMSRVMINSTRHLHPQGGNQFTPLHTWKEFWGSSTIQLGIPLSRVSINPGMHYSIERMLEVIIDMSARLTLVIHGIRGNTATIALLQRVPHYTDFLFSFISVKLSCIHSPSSKREKALSNMEMSEWPQPVLESPNYLMKSDLTLVQSQSY